MLNNIRSRQFKMLLYLDNDIHTKVLDYIINTYPNILYINHNKDRLNDIELKKEHIHLYIRFDNARTIESFVNELISGLSINKEDIERFIRKCDNRDQFFKYLTHIEYKETDKHHYDIIEFYGSEEYINIVENIINGIKISDDIKAMSIYDYIYSYNHTQLINMRDVFKYVCDNNLWSEYRRSYTIFRDLINERNIDVRVVHGGEIL